MAKPDEHVFDMDEALSRITFDDETGPDQPVQRNANALSRKLWVSKFKRMQDAAPKGAEVTWSELVKSLSTHQRRPEKNGPAFNGAKFRAGTRRANENVEWIDLAIVDIDDGLTLEMARKELDGQAYVIYTSFSHTALAHKFRVVMPLCRSISPDEWSRQVFPALSEKFGGRIDKACKDASRMYFLPAASRGSVDTAVFVGEGAWLDPDQFPVKSMSRSLASTIPTVIKLSQDVRKSVGRDVLHPNQGLQQVMTRCQFMKWASDPQNQPQVSEPLWSALIANACRFDGSDPLIHQASCHDSRYDAKETQARIERLRGSNAPHRCETIRELGFKGCPPAGCSLPNGVATTSPVTLGKWAEVPLDGMPPDSSLSQEEQHRKLAEKLAKGTIKLKDVSQPVLASLFVWEKFPEGFVYSNGQYFGYREGIFVRLDVKAEVDRPLSEILGALATTPFVNQAREMVAMRSAVPGDGFHPDRNHLCLRNGTLNLQTMQLGQHDPKLYLRSKLEVDWKPEAECHRFMRFLDEIFQGDDDAKAKIRFLQQWIGYCLTPDTSQQKMLWMVGAGANGKSVLLHVIQALIGKANVSAQMLGDFERGFIRAELEGKLVNISADMPTDTFINDGFVKAIIAGDSIQAERKYMPPFDFKPICRLICAMNGLPRTNDTSDGLYRRIIILNFNRQFKAEEQDTNLLSNLLSELEGILVWALEGLKDLRRSGRFVVPASSAAAVAAYQTETNPVDLFARSCLIKVEGKRGMLPKDLYQGYVEWTRENGHKAKSNVQFGRELAKLGYEKYKSGQEYWMVRASEEGAGYLPFDAGRTSSASNDINEESAAGSSNSPMFVV